MSVIVAGVVFIALMCWFGGFVSTGEEYQEEIDDSYADR